MSLVTLNKKQIEDLLDFIRPNPNIPKESADSLVEINKEYFRKQLRKQKVKLSILPELKRQLEQVYISSQIQPGESVGIITAQSIGEKQTQNNLNTFHKAGSSDNPVDTVSNFAELLNATKAKQSKSMSSIVYTKKKCDTIAKLRQTIGSSLVEITLDKIVLHNDEKEEDYVVHLNKADETWYQPFQLLYNDRFRKYTDCISVKVNLEILYMYRLTLKDIVNILEVEYDEELACVFSPDNIARLDIFIDTNEINIPDNRDEECFDIEHIKEIYLEEVVLPKLKNTHIAGIPGIENMYFQREKDIEGGGDNWYVEADGCNFPEILSNSIFDNTRCITSSVWDIYHTLGIEAAREFMIEQFQEIMPGINGCHAMLLVDWMTSSGTICSITRYTHRNLDLGPLSKASFEETLDNFLKAGIYGQEETTAGVSAAIICGKRSGVGSGICQVSLDIERL